ncbi:hypothetical protein LguiB_030240 [Lonicera macranthoides]
MTVDAERVGDFSSYMHDPWLVLLQVSLALVILYKNLGLASVSAFVAIMIVMLVNVPLSKWQGKYQDKFMKSKDKRIGSSNTAIEIVDGNFVWDASSPNLTLKDINFGVSHGTRIAVSGTVGSGKSSVLSCISREMPKVSGTIKLSGTKVYVAQSPWIQSGKIEDNILFGKEMDKERYKTILEACLLKKDLEILPSSNQTKTLSELDSIEAKSASDQATTAEVDHGIGKHENKDNQNGKANDIVGLKGQLFQEEERERQSWFLSLLEIYYDSLWRDSCALYIVGTDTFSATSNWK